MNAVQLRQLGRIGKMREDRLRRQLAECLALIEAARTALDEARQQVIRAERAFHRADSDFRAAPYCPQRQFNRAVTDQRILEAVAEHVQRERDLEEAESAAATLRQLMRKAEERGRQLDLVRRGLERARTERAETQDQEDRATGPGRIAA